MTTVGSHKQKENKSVRNLIQAEKMILYSRFLSGLFLGCFCQSATLVTAERDHSCLVKDNFREMWCFRQFTSLFFFTSFWTLLGTKVEAFAPFSPINLLLRQLLTGQFPRCWQLEALQVHRQHLSEQEWQPACQERGLRSKAKRILLKKKKQKNNLTSLLYNWRALGINMHVGTVSGTVLHSDVCRWELRWQCALSKESRTCSVNGAGSGRLAINPKRIEDSNLPLTAAVTWSDLWRPANYLSK